MYRTALRTASRPMLNGTRTCTRAAPRRLASTASPTDKPRSWKSSAARWGLAVGAVYYYTTSPVFADEALPKTVPAPASFAESDLPTVDSVIEEKRRQISARLEPNEPKDKQPEAAKATEQPAGDAAQSTMIEGGPGQLQEEAGQQGAFNPETGEINWDCPCLGGMADGPCGEQFKTAFSCFVYSDEEPKGMDCIEKFQGMQECFREYPEIYGAELADEEAADAALDEPETAGEYQKIRDEHPPISDAAVAKDGAETHQLPGAAPLKDPIPTKWDDATAANKEHVMNPHEKQEEQEKKEKKE